MLCTLFVAQLLQGIIIQNGGLIGDLGLKKHQFRAKYTRINRIKQ